jgi:hypothetical protein
MSKLPDVAGALAAMNKAKAGGRGRKSAVYLWLRKNHDALAAAFEINAPSWAAMADYLGKSGIMGGDGNRPTAAGVRSAWTRVVSDIARRRAAAGAPVSSTTMTGMPSASPAGLAAADEESPGDAKFPFVKAK